MIISAASVNTTDQQQEGGVHKVKLTTQDQTDQQQEGGVHKVKLTSRRRAGLKLTVSSCC